MQTDIGTGPLRPEDLYRFSWVSDPQVSPQGDRVAYVVTRPEDRGKKYRSEIRMISVAGSAEGLPAGCGWRFTAGPRDRLPRWSPDGRTLAFLSDRSGEAQIHLIQTDGGEAIQLTRVAGGVSELVWSPNGTVIGFIARFPSPEAGFRTGGAVAVDSGKEEPSDVRIFGRLHYKDNGKGLWDGKRAHLSVIEAAGGEPRQITSGPYDDSAPAWSPCGSWLAFSCNRTPDPDRTPVSDIWVVSAAGGEPRKVTRSEGPAFQPSWSPDGQWLAFYGHRNQYQGATLDHLMIVPVDGSAARLDVLTGWDRSVGISGGSDMMASASPPPMWSADGRHLLFLGGDRGATNLYRIRAWRERPLEGLPQPEQLTCGRHVIYGLSAAGGGSLAIAAVATQTNPGDLWVFRLGEPGEGAQAGAWVLTDLNPWLRGRSLVEPEEFSVKQPGGEEINGWVMKPTMVKAGHKCPLVLEIHGGPHSAYGCAFFHEFQVLCGEGFGVLFANPPGSSGYGQAFQAATRHDWGGRDFRALMAVVDEAARLEWVDEARLGVTGGSYGGYMANWMIGQTGRFKAAVSLRSTANRFSQFGTSDVGYNQGDFEFRGYPWDEPDFYLSRSPITCANRVQTPLLLIHSENDLRCPIEQAEQFYTALKVLGRVVEMARFPNENHELSRSGQPIHRVERLGLIAGWFKKYLTEA